MQLLLVVALYLCRDTALLQQAWAIPQEAVARGSISVMGAFLNRRARGRGLNLLGR